MDQMENAEIENIDKDYVLYLNDESFLSLNSANSQTLENESFVNSEDSLPISGTHICVTMFPFTPLFF